MRILYVITSLEGGGAQKLLRDITLNIRKKNKCDILVLNKKDDKYSNELNTNGIKCKFIIPKKWFSFKTLKRISCYIKKGNYDVIHVHLFPALYYCSLLKRFVYRKKPFIYTEHNTDNKRRHIFAFRLIEKWIYKPYDYVVSISRETKKALIKWINPSDIKKYLVINNGIPVEEFFKAKAYHKNFFSKKISDKDILLCMIGSFTEQKNHSFIIKVMKKLPEKYKLLLLGEGVLEDKIKKEVCINGLSERVLFLGFRNDVAEIIKTSDIIVIPSVWEGFGLVAVEAMACGKQIVCSNVPGLSNVVGKVGIKVKKNDIDGFCSGIYLANKRLKNREDFEEIILEQACKFDVNTMIKQYLNLYEKCVSK